ncbi:hypothetical protein SCALM49S_06879 [Streptomyces californicus]
MTNHTVDRFGPWLSGPNELRNNGVVKNDGRAPQEDLATGERSTRDRVARSILGHGPSTVADLAGRLGLTQAAVRRHLDALVSDNVVEAREQRVYGARTRGRPAKVFALTACGRDAFDQSYDKLAADALRFIADSGGDEAVIAFARARMAATGEAYRAAVEAAEPRRRTEALAEALSADGIPQGPGLRTAHGGAVQAGEDDVEEDRAGQEDVAGGVAGGPQRQQGVDAGSLCAHRALPGSCGGSRLDPDRLGCGSRG